MNNFFKALYLIIAFVILIVIYYYFRNVIEHKRKTKLARMVREKNYLDEKIYTREYLAKLIKKLTSAEIRWVSVSSGIYPEFRLELVFNALEKNINILFYSEYLLPNDQQAISKIGGSIKNHHDKNYIISAPMNSKIITDIVYYVIEKTLLHKKLYNVKIKTSDL